jgi:hypothetical protein
MTTSFALDTLIGEMSQGELRSTLSAFIPSGTDAARVAAIEAILNGPSGNMIRTAMTRWISQHIVPASRLVPAAHARWIPVVRDAMVFVIMNFSAARLAAKFQAQGNGSDLPYSVSMAKFAGQLNPAKLLQNILAARLPFTPK